MSVKSKCNNGSCSLILLIVGMGTLLHSKCLSIRVKISKDPSDGNRQFILEVLSRSLKPQQTNKTHVSGVDTCTRTDVKDQELEVVCIWSCSTVSVFKEATFFQKINIHIYNAVVFI